MNRRPGEEIASEDGDTDSWIFTGINPRFVPVFMSSTGWLADLAQGSGAIRSGRNCVTAALATAPEKKGQTREIQQGWRNSKGVCALCCRWWSGFLQYQSNTQRRSSCAGRCRECLSLVCTDTGTEDTIFYFCSLWGGERRDKKVREGQKTSQPEFHISICQTSLVCGVIKVALDGNLSRFGAATVTLLKFNPTANTINSQIIFNESQ